MPEIPEDFDDGHGGNIVEVGHRDPILDPEMAPDPPSVILNHTMARQLDGDYCIRIQASGGRHIELSAWEVGQIMLDLPGAGYQAGEIRQRMGYAR